MGDLCSFYSNAYTIAFKDVFSFAVQLAQGMFPGNQSVLRNVTRRF